MTEFSQSGAICLSDAAYVLGALSPSDRRAFEDHLRDCADCRESVQRLAGMPGLLALATADAVEETGPPVPESLLPGLIVRVVAARRRRRWAVAGLMAASIAVVVAVAGTLIVRAPTEIAAGGTSTTSTSVAPTTTDNPEPMTQLLPGPMTASLELVDKKWGTAITVFCQYDQGVDSSVSYGLAVVDTSGKVSSAGSWRAVPGVTAKVSTATAVPRDQIEYVEVQLPDGRTILRYED